MRYVFLLCLFISSIVYGQEPVVTIEENRWILEAEKKFSQSNGASIAVEFLKSKITDKNSAALDYALWSYANANNNIKLAEESLNNALKKLPTFHRAKLALAQLYITGNKLENATGLLQQLLVDGYENRFDVY
ncbi:MAG: tetratricopeptide repeat protein, partial [Lentisphaeria bacterium]